MNKASDILIAAKAVIANPDNWTTGVLARNASGDAVPVADGAACQFCTWGAVHKVTGASNYGVLEERYLDSSAKVLGYYDSMRLNDTADHATVMRMFDDAIERALMAEANDSEA